MPVFVCVDTNNVFIIIFNIHIHPHIYKYKQIENQCYYNDLNTDVNFRVSTLFGAFATNNLLQIDRYVKSSGCIVRFLRYIFID